MPYDFLMDNLKSKIPGAIEPMIEAELANMLDEFCRRSLTWREEAEVDLVAGIKVYEVAPPIGETFVHMIAAEHPQANLRGSFFEFGQFNLYYQPEAADVAAGPVTLTMAMTFDMNARGDLRNAIPEDMWEEYHQTFMDGTLGRMMAQAAKPYSNAQLAVYHTRAFNRDVAQARHRANTHNIPGAQLWRYPKWA